MRKTLHEIDIYDYSHHQSGEFNNITDVDGIKVGHSPLLMVTMCEQVLLQ